MKASVKRHWDDVVFHHHARPFVSPGRRSGLLRAQIISLISFVAFLVFHLSCQQMRIPPTSHKMVQECAAVGQQNAALALSDAHAP